MTYVLEDEFRLVLDDRDDVSLNFTKVREWRLELTWDDIPVFLDQNGSHNFTVYARNVGSENGTFDIAGEVPDGWLFESEVDNVTLNMSQSTSFWVLINASEDAAAGPSDCKVMAYPRKGMDDPSEMDVEISINQFYGFKLRVPEGLVGNIFYDEEKAEHRAHYDFVVENTGNGNENISLEFGTVPGWEFDFPSDKVTLGPYGQENVPIEVTLPLQSELRAQTLTITGTSLNAPDNEVRTLDFELSLPELSAEESGVSGSVDDEPLEWPEEAPGFGVLAALVAVLVTAIATVQRRRWST